MPKVAINRCWGGFGLSEAAVFALAARKNVKLYVKDPDSYFPTYFTSEDFNYDNYFDTRPEKRDDPDLVAVVENLGEKANGRHASLKVVDVPDDVDWYIHDYDGMESVHENHRSWG
jgi:hypothetical protein